MPSYVYRCPVCGIESEVIHGATDTVAVFCPANDGGLMRKRFLPPRVNWGGLPPSKGEIHPKIKAAFDEGYRRRRDRGA